MKRSGRVLVILTFAIFAFTLTFVLNLFLKERVQANETAKREAAAAAVFEGADSYSETNYDETWMKRFLEENGFTDDQVVVNNATFIRNAQRDVIGVIIQVSAYKKFGGIISMLVGVQNDGTVTGCSILSISEAKGLDMMVKEDRFLDQFRNVKTEAFTLVNYEATRTGDILAVSGAEDASQAVVTGANAAILAKTFIEESYGGVY